MNLFEVGLIYQMNPSEVVMNRFLLWLTNLTIKLCDWRLENMDFATKDDVQLVRKRKRELVESKEDLMKRLNKDA